MLWDVFRIFKAVAFGKKRTGIIRRYECVGNFRGTEYWKYVIDVTIDSKPMKFISAEVFAQYDGRQPSKYLQCEMTVYCLEDEYICTLMKPADILIFLLAAVIIVLGSAAAIII